MNFNLFDDMNGLILRERENNLNSQRNATNSNNTSNGTNGMTGESPRFPENMPIGMAYVPFQQWSEVYNEDEAFSNGTLFPELNFPFERGGGLGE